ncbi:hypothetical protein GCM10009639_03070 [Kitasatospora putterlickiae]|uniref:Uncharacterized protein n=1 Tax=Kitasatospora putterlickiae TaxID=221725 RepID=A0ABP4I7H6_9ACTN
MATPSDEEGGKTPRKRTQRLGGWVVVQILWIAIRHFLSSCWDDNGPTW